MRPLLSGGYRAAALLGMAVLLGACSSPAATDRLSSPLAQPSWPAPADPMALAVRASLTPEAREYLETHTHAHLDVFVDGQPVVVPSGIGIDIAVAGVTDTPTADGTGHQYFVKTCPAACLSPLHTHDPSGVIHTESKVKNHPPDLLGQFFTEWGVRLDASCVGEYCEPDAQIRIYMNGTLYTGKPQEIALTSHLEIAIVIGRAPALIPSTWPFDSPA